MSKAEQDEPLFKESLASKQPASSDPLFEPLRCGSRQALAKVITLLESGRPEQQARALALLDVLHPGAPQTMRLGISGTPGVGKSTLIEALGLAFVAQGYRVAVLAIDPSSTLSGGSILGDKTRMPQLAVHPAVYIRPSPSSGALGGVAEKTREAMLACEVAGYNLILIETVGIGQSESMVAGMTDCFILLQQPHAGDELQAMKRGVLELADWVLVNKADLDPQAAALMCMRIEAAWNLQAASKPRRAQCLSAQDRAQVARLANDLHQALEQQRALGEWQQRRQQQNIAWMWDLLRAGVWLDFLSNPGMQEALHNTQEAIAQQALSPRAAAAQLRQRFASSN